MSPEEIAKRSAEAMWANDDASKWLGMSLDEVGPGAATLSFTVEKHHTNGHDICHGGYIFTLADSAFAFACNSHNRVAVTQHSEHRSHLDECGAGGASRRQRGVAGPLGVVGRRCPGLRLGG